MKNLRTSANKGSNDAYDVHTSLTEKATAVAAKKERSELRGDLKKR